MVTENTANFAGGQVAVSRFIDQISKKPDEEGNEETAEDIISRIKTGLARI